VRPGSRDRDGATLEKIGLLLGVTRDRVRQIEARALRKLVTDPGTLAAWRPLLARWQEECYGDDCRTAEPVLAPFSRFRAAPPPRAPIGLKSA